MPFCESQCGEYGHIYVCIYDVGAKWVCCGQREQWQKEHGSDQGQ